MEALVKLLPKTWQPKAKAIIGAIGVTLTVLSMTFASLWITVPLAILTALSIYQAPAPGYVGPEIT